MTHGDCKNTSAHFHVHFDFQQTMTATTTTTILKSKAHNEREKCEKKKKRDRKTTTIIATKTMMPRSSCYKIPIDQFTSILMCGDWLRLFSMGWGNAKQNEKEMKGIPATATTMTTTQEQQCTWKRRNVPPSLSTSKCATEVIHTKWNWDADTKWNEKKKKNNITKKRLAHPTRMPFIDKRE